MKRASTHRPTGFSLVELLVVLAVISILVGVALPAYSSAMTSGRAAASMSNLRQLAAANLTYASEHDGYYCPAAEDYSYNVLWCGARIGSSSTYDPSKGLLSSYLGTDGRIKICPLFANMVTVDSFDAATGGYGYNEMYIGGTAASMSNPYQSIKTSNVPRPSMTVMFTTTALAKDNGLQEYPFCEPYQWPIAGWGGVQPSVHFRDHGYALVAWCDGHVTAELPNQATGINVYGGNNTQDNIGWFGPTDNNGYWNPAYTGP